MLSDYGHNSGLKSDAPAETDAQRKLLPPPGSSTLQSGEMGIFTKASESKHKLS